MGKVVQSVTKPITQGIGQLNPFNPGSAVGKGIASIPGVSALQKGATQVFQPIEKAVVQPVGRGLASLDKLVGNAIPGGWGTIGTVAASMIPGGQFAALGLPKTAAMTGLGALTGSGVLRPGRGFNLQGAMMGGAMAYGASKLADFAAAAGGAETGSQMATLPTSEVTPELLNTFTSTPVSTAPEVLTQLGGPGAPSFPSIGQQVMSGNFSDAARQLGSRISDIPSNISDFATKATTPSTYENFGKAYMENVSDIGSGIKNLVTEQVKPAAVTAATGINPMQAAGALGFGATGLMALDEQEKLLKQQLAAQQISQQEFDQAMASINSQRDYAASVVSQSPFNPNPDRSVSRGDTLYRRGAGEENLYARTPTTLYAYGGSVDDELGTDDLSMEQGNMQRGFMGGGSLPAFASGGQPRFLSGGGDGMSDSIPATINGRQPARLADGEFVIPADVVSHLGNGSSKAGAKQLYTMMDKVRKARTGNHKQGKQINPRKYMPA